MLDIIFLYLLSTFLYKSQKFYYYKKSQETDLSPQNRHSHRADAIHCVPIETALAIQRRSPQRS